MSGAHVVCSSPPLAAMTTPRLNHAQLKAFSDCLHVLYGQPTGDDPVEAVLNVLAQMTRVSGLTQRRVWRLAFGGFQ